MAATWGLPGIEQTPALRTCDRFGIDTSSAALDMTNFAAFIDTGNAEAPIAPRGKAKHKRVDPRVVGLGLVVARDGRVPLLPPTPVTGPTSPGVPDMIKALAARHTALAAAAGQGDTEMTVVSDAGQNPAANFALPADTRRH